MPGDRMDVVSWIRSTRAKGSEGQIGDAGIQAPADHEAGNGGGCSRGVDTLSVHRGRTTRRKVDVSERSCPPRDGGYRQHRIVCGMDRKMTAADRCWRVPASRRSRASLVLEGDDDAALSRRI